MDQKEAGALKFTNNSRGAAVKATWIKVFLSFPLVCACLEASVLVRLWKVVVVVVVAIL